MGSRPSRNCWRTRRAGQRDQRGDGRGRDAGTEDALHGGLAVLDAVYSPLETRLLRDAADAGATTVDGAWMLLYQASKLRDLDRSGRTGRRDERSAALATVAPATRSPPCQYQANLSGGTDYHEIMAILQKLKSLLGFDESDSERGGAREVGVTVEREGSTGDRRDADRTEPAAGGITPEPSRTSTSDSSAAASATESEEGTEPAEPSPIEEAEPDADAAAEPESDETDAAPDAEPETESEPESESESDADATDDAGTDSETAEVDSETADMEPEAAGDADAASEDTESAPSVDDTAETTEPDETTREPVDAIKGIGPAYADRLAGAGVDTVDELADADAAELADQTDISEKRIQAGSTAPKSGNAPPPTPSPLPIRFTLRYSSLRRSIVGDHSSFRRSAWHRHPGNRKRITRSFRLENHERSPCRDDAGRVSRRRSRPRQGHV